VRVISQAMIWIQTLPAFVLWLVYIWIMRRWVQEGKNRYASQKRSFRILAMIAALLGSGGVLLGGLWAISRMGWIQTTTLTIPGVIAVAIIGLLFVHMQMLATAITLSLAIENETTKTTNSSDKANTIRSN
jgi:uncharacterized membrane protein